MPISSFSAPSAIAKPGVCTSSTRPASPYEGQVIFETDTDKTLVWNGSAWVLLSTGTANPVGLELVKTQTVGTTVASVTVSNCFSATYDNYRIIYTGGNASANANLNMSISGSTGSTYLTSGYFMSPTVATLNAFAPAASTIWVAGPQNTTRQAIVIDLFRPFATEQTFGRTAGLGTGSFYDFGLADTNSASSTGFTFFAGTGTITGGIIYVYGYRQA